MQISRLGQPLVNEAVIPYSVKDTFNAIPPSKDAAALPFVKKPELAALLKNVCGVNAPTDNRNDLVTVFLKGLPGLNQPNGVTPSEQLRLNTNPFTGQTASRLGVIGGDNNGFPNGRRLTDDVVDIALQVVGGEIAGNPNDLGDGVDTNDAEFGHALPVPRPASVGFGGEVVAPSTVRQDVADGWRDNSTARRVTASRHRTSASSRSGCSPSWPAARRPDEYAPLRCARRSRPDKPSGSCRRRGGSSPGSPSEPRPLCSSHLSEVLVPMIPVPLQRVIRPLVLVAGVLAVVVGLTAAATALWAGPASHRTADPVGPAAADRGQINDPAALVANLQAKLRVHPGDAQGWAALGFAYVEQARITADPTYYPKAQQALARARQIAPRQH